MSINLQTGGYVAPQVLPGARSTDIQVAQKQQPEHVPELLPTPGDTNTTPTTPADAEQQRYDQVEAASKGLIGNTYPVSDRSFTIFKTADGTYVTRYTSLRDGKVTYVPELKLIQYYGPGQIKAEQPGTKQPQPEIKVKLPTLPLKA